MSNIPETGRTRRVAIRLVAIQILVLSLLLTLGGRLWYLQIRNGEQYTEEASRNHVQEVVTPAVRGAILDANGVPLADNENRLVVSADRTELLKQPDDGEAVLARVAGVLGMKEKDVTDKVRLCDAQTPQPCWNGSPYQPIPISDEATSQQALQIVERPDQFPGITAEPTAVRRYGKPKGAKTAQVLGYLSPVSDEEIAEREASGKPPLLRSDQIGRAGLERTYDSELRGTAGVTRHEVDNLGRVIGKAGSTPAKPGSTVVTSIDSRVQALAEKELVQAMKEARTQFDHNTGRNYKADSGAIVVMEAKTGRVVAMASAPTYDPNVWVGGIDADEYRKLTGEKSNYPLLNRATQGQAAPGSIFKVVSTAAAVRAGYPLDGRYDCSSAFDIEGHSFKNFESQSYGPISLGRALEVSCDTVFYRLAYQEWKKDGGNDPKKPKDWFFRTAKDFGLGSATGVDLPSEADGRIPDRKWKKDYYDLNKDAWCEQAKSKKDDYGTAIARENCAEGFRMRAGDTVNFSIGQGDTLVTPIQMASIYAAISNGGTIYEPAVGKAVISPDGARVKELKPKVKGKLPISRKTRDYMDEALAGVATRGTAAWRFGGWPQAKIPMHAKTGTAEVYGKQTTSWFATYTKEYSIVMTISQGGTGSGASAPAVRKIYNALYGVDGGGGVNKKNGLLPKPKTELPKINKDGTIQQADLDKKRRSWRDTKTPSAPTSTPGAGTTDLDDALPPSSSDQALAPAGGSGAVPPVLAALPADRPHRVQHARKRP
ncbi:penicillin-binding protein [Wenjunlia vitaminophila]|uniref:Penicillin-binding protein n=1 Tax=Wenjunlia vitaminophila TaxID=76728 RepID=A0A0T6LJW7_WENVI|nr:penicillin-binding protein 2 [Wenjunlia vitaminophila]KRV46387.1 penicillin-binding protein [Wenjunlia vitaminophila]